MNFDGKAFVKNTTTSFYISEHDYAFVRDAKEQSINNLCITKNKGTALVPLRATNNNELEITNKLYLRAFVPHTVQVYNEIRYTTINPLKYSIIRDATINNNQSFSYFAKKVYVSRIQPTNIKYNPKSTIVYDSEQKQNEVLFAGISVNVNSKVEVVIPEKTTDYSDISLVVQKNCFIEIKISDSVTDVINLPDALIYLPGYIKGTFTQSGEYNIKVKYPDGEQIINIIVPYYQRLL